MTRYKIISPFAGNAAGDVVSPQCVRNGLGHAVYIGGSHIDDLLELGAIEPVKDEPKHPLLWKPEDGDEYWYIGFDNQVFRDFFNKKDKADIFIIDVGNYYKTCESAEQALARQKAIVRVSRRIIELNGNWEINWVNDNQSIFEIFYSHTDNRFIKEKYDDKDIYWERLSILPYAASSDICATIIEENEQDLKLIFNIKKND